MSKRIVSVLVVAVMAMGMWVFGPTPAAEALPGHWAWAWGPGQPVDQEVMVSAKDGELYVGSYGCRSWVKLKPLQFSTNVKMKKADVSANTPCGFVTVHWEGYGDLFADFNGLPYQVKRYARASGSISGRPFSVAQHTKAGIALSSL